MKKVLFITAIAALIYGCAGNTETKTQEGEATETGADLMKEDASSSSKALDDKGIGKFTNVEVSPTLDQKMASIGSGVYDLKCSACHKLTAERIVGPGWEGVTSRRTAEWIMNFSVNTDEMIEKDPAAQAMLELCMVRMPNQNLSDDDARAVYEFMRKNDGVK